MKFKNNIFPFLALLLFFQVGFSQQKVMQKKIEKNLNEAGIAFSDLDISKSLTLSKKALNDAIKIKDNGLIAKSYNLIGLNFEEFYDVKKGIDYYKKALDYANLADNDSLKDWIYNNLGSAYSYRKIDFKKSIEFYKKGLFYAKKINDPIEIMYTNLNTCSAYFAVKDFKNGIVYLDNVKDYVLKSDEIEAKLSMSTLYGSYYSYLNENDKAEMYFNQALEYGKQNKSDLINSNVCDVYEDFSAHYKKNKNFEKALYYLNLNKELTEKIYNEERLKKAKIEGTQIELDEYKRQIDKIENEKNEQLVNLNKSKIIVVLFVILLIFLLSMLYLFYKNNKLRKKSNEDLQNANEQLIIAKENAEVASQLKTQFVSTISHELRTPLYGIVGITNIIIEEHKELEGSPHLNSLKFSARYLLSLVNDLLQINKIEENKIVLENMIFNISDEINVIIDSLNFIALKNKNKLHCKIDSNIPDALIGDKLRLSQIFMNLTSNALKFTKDGEVMITADLERTEGKTQFIKFQVKDTGVGIAEEDKDKIFDKFVQLERKEGDYQGTGLGLSIVQKLTELFGSEISLESELHKGTTFSFTIGFDADEKKKNEIINNIEVNLSMVEIFKILVVEDNKINQIVTKKVLEGNNFICKITDNGYGAVEILENEKFDLVLMDINMPIINGFDTTKIIRDKGITIPIVALTAFDKQDILDQALTSGMNDIIIKPFEPAMLFQVISNLLEKKNAD